MHTDVWSIALWLFWKKFSYYHINWFILAKIIEFDGNATTCLQGTLASITDKWLSCIKSEYMVVVSCSVLVAWAVR